MSEIAKIKEKELTERFQNLCTEVHAICSSGTDKLNMTTICSKHSVNYLAVQAMKNLNILSSYGTSAATRYSWTGDVPSFEMAERVKIEVRRLDINRNMAKRQFKRPLVPLQNKEHHSQLGILMTLYDIHKNHKDGTIIDPSKFECPPKMFEKLIDLGMVRKSMVPGMYTWIGEAPSKDLSILLYDECCKDLATVKADNQIKEEIEPVHVGKIKMDKDDSFLMIMKMQAAQLEREIQTRTAKLSQLKETIKLFENER